MNDKGKYLGVNRYEIIEEVFELGSTIQIKNISENLVDSMDKLSDTTKFKHARGIIRRVLKEMEEKNDWD